MGIEGGPGGTLPPGKENGDPGGTLPPGRKSEAPGENSPPGEEDVGPEESIPRDRVAVFGSALECAQEYAAILATQGVEWGVIGPHEVPKLWDRHLLNCAVVAELIPDASGTLVDIGSGAGLPGLVFAMLCQRLRVTLVEPLERRVTFLNECVGKLGLGNVTVVRSRAEDLAGSLAADVVTARAVAPLDRLVPLAAGVARSGGTVLAIKGRSAEEELTRARSALRRVGARRAEVLRVGQGKVSPATTVVRFLAR
ncbi:MAG: 16S rRNA (guanine(527)-N(7))-methyltransferase RsmG [Streptosporangiaceae bacterium]|nr:16S rRNA (guanine(527)-N(7))-methyltransferase RsmG [Streptosporangiaceae bacterium]